MASIFSHTITGVVFAKSGIVLFDIKSKFKLYFFSILGACIPDADVLSFNFGIPYTHWLGHRGVSHSLVFALVWALLITLLFFRRPLEKIKFKWIGLILFLSTASHGVLDAMTSGGRGVGFFIPFTDERYFLPFRPVLVSPLGASNFFSEWGWKVLQSEFVWIMLPSLFCLLILSIFQKRYDS